MSFSTTHLTGFYSPTQLHEYLRKLAALELLFIEEENDLCYYNFTVNWDKGIDMAEVNNGSGDTMYIFFTPKGTFIKGFDHESPVSPYAQEEYGIWPGMYDGCPAHFMDILGDVSMNKEEVSFCIWNENDGQGWKTGNVKFENNEDDGSAFLLGTIYTSAEKYKEWADDYYDMDLPLTVIQKFYNENRLTDEMIMAINPNADSGFVKTQLSLIGY